MTKKVWIWLILTFVSSSLYFITYKMFGETWMFISLAIAMFMPAFMVVVVKKLIYKEPLKGRYYLHFKFNKFVVLGVLMPLLLIFYVVLLNGLITPATIGVNQVYREQFMTLGVSEDMLLPVVLATTLLNGIIAGITINAVFAFGEEYGWRGFLQKEWSYMGPWKSSALIGAVWGLWHAPIVVQGYNFPDHPYIGVFLMIIATTFLGIIISYFTKRSGTILTAAFFHGVFNAVAGLTIALTVGYVDIWHGPFGVVAIFVYAATAELLYLYEKRRQLKGQKRQEEI